MSERYRSPERIDATASFQRIALAAELFERHASSLFATARPISICAADAEDSVQRALEVFIRRGPFGADDRPLGWLRVVVRNEAILVRQRRERLLAGGVGVGESKAGLPAGELQLLPCVRPGPAERLAGKDRSREAAGSLARLGRDQRRALGLQAAGCSYAEIAAICDWTYTKVNRCISEGRAKLTPLAAEPAS